MSFLSFQTDLTHLSLKTDLRKSYVAISWDYLFKSKRLPGNDEDSTEPAQNFHRYHIPHTHSWLEQQNINY